MLGEDETLAKNRLALICSNCRLVNGQAPPGTRSLEEIGRWRCGGCGGWNGFEKVEGERGVERLVEQIRRRDDAEVEGGWTRVSRGDEHVKTSPSEGKDRRDAKNEDGERDRVVKEEIPDSTDETDDDGDGIANTEDGEADEQKAETVSKPVTRSKRRGGRNTTQKK